MPTKIPANAIEAIAQRLSRLRPARLALPADAPVRGGMIGSTYRMMGARACGDCEEKRGFEPCVYSGRLWPLCRGQRRLMAVWSR